MENLEIIEYSINILEIVALIFCARLIIKGFISFKPLKKLPEELDKKFNVLETQLRLNREENLKALQDHFKEIYKETRDIKEQMAFMEAETIMAQIIPTENSRSEAAKKAWVKRKQRQISKQERD